jgi:hypothetical protein
MEREGLGCGCLQLSGPSPISPAPRKGTVQRTAAVDWPTGRRVRWEEAARRQSRFSFRTITVKPPRYWSCGRGAGIPLRLDHHLP